MKTIIFGTGNIYNKKKKDLYLLNPDIELVAFLDNDSNKTENEGIPVYRPDKINELVYDQILLMSKKSEEMREQLLKMGVPAGAIFDWDQFLSLHHLQRMHLFCGSNEKKVGRRIMILSTELGYNGGTIAATYAVEALLHRDYEVVLVAERGDLKYINETQKQGINIILYPNLYRMGPEEKFFVCQFDYVIVNVFQMVRFAVEISKIRPTIWWIHEVPYFIEKTIRTYPDYTKKECLMDLNVFAVSSIAKNAFLSYYPNIRVNELPYGIPDYLSSLHMKTKPKNRKIVFALVGTFELRKAQDIFIYAIRKLNKSTNEASFLIIGSMGGSGRYRTETCALAEETAGVKITGSFERNDLEKIFQKIDVLVCPSRLDPLPIVCTEAMMFAKPIIASNNTGTAAFIEDGWNGFVCKSEEPEDLASKMQWCLDHPEKLPEMGENARKTYGQHFSMESFADRLEKALAETENAFSGS